MATLPKGKYYLADPCYIMEGQQYQANLLKSNYFNLDNRGGISTDIHTGLMYAVFSTAYGDGQYDDNMGRSYGVDAGCIACIPVGMVDAPKYPDLVHVQEFAEDFEVDVDNHGMIYFGDVQINTDPLLDDDEEGSIWDEDDEEDE